MNSDSLYAFYGSLRRGMINYDVYREALEYKFSARLKGFKMYGLRHYPFAVKTGVEKDSIVVEVFRVIDPVMEQKIHELEKSVGYFYDEVKIEETKIGIYLFHQPENYPEVIGGDWVKFFGFR